MKLTHLSTVSAIALMLAVAPVSAQQTTTQPADEPALGTTQPADEPTVGTTRPADEPTVGTTRPADEPTVGDTTDAVESPARTAQDVGTERLSVAELDELMNEIGIEDAEMFGGQVVVTRTEDGQPIIMVLGPQDFEHGEVAVLDDEAFPDLRERMTEAGFQDVRQDHAWQLFQGTLDGHYVLATSGDPDWSVGVAERPTDDGVAERAIGEPQADLAEREFGIGEPMGDYDRDRIDEAVGELDIEDRDEFKGKIVRARTDEGKSIKLLVGTEGFAADEEIELSEDELRERLEDAGLSNVQVVDQDIAMYRGTYNDMSALIIGGRGFADDPMQTGARQQPTGTGIDQQD